MLLFGDHSFWKKVCDKLGFRGCDDLRGFPPWPSVSRKNAGTMVFQSSLEMLFIFLNLHWFLWKELEISLDLLSLFSSSRLNAVLLWVYIA